MKNKINIRLIGIAVLAVFATVIGITIVYYSLFQRQVRKDLEISAMLLKDTLLFESQNTDSTQIDLSTDINDLRITWINSDGRVLYDNDTSIELLPNHKDRPEIQGAFERGTGETIRRSDTMNKNTFYYAILLDNGTVLRVATEAESLWSVFLSAAPIAVFIILLVIAICIVISNLLTRQLLKPVEVMVSNLQNADYESPYKELDPISLTLRSQHTDILMAAKARADFTANVSHELKTPLTAISGYAELLLNDMVAEEQKNHFYKEIHKNSHRLLALINDIIKLSELDRNDMEKFFEEIDLYELAKTSREELLGNAKLKNISLNIEGEKAIALGNRELLRELIDNLLANSIRYNNPGGRVNISVEKKDGCAILTVEDNGIGIPKEDQNRVFERFYRVDKSRSRATGGTGLGLAIVKHIVEIHDANIKLNSNLGEGTTISVQFRQTK